MFLEELNCTNLERLETFQWKQMGSFIFHRILTRTTLILSNVVGPAEQIMLCGHPVAFIAMSVYGQPQVSYKVLTSNTSIVIFVWRKQLAPSIMFYSHRKQLTRQSVVGRLRHLIDLHYLSTNTFFDIIVLLIQVIYYAPITSLNFWEIK
jgi:hypothetical protein